MREELMVGLQSVPAFPVLCSLFGLGSHLYPLVCPGPLPAVVTQLARINFLWDTQ